MKITEIRITEYRNACMDGVDLDGADNPEQEERAAMDRYTGALACALAGWWPDAEIAVNWQDSGASAQIVAINDEGEDVSCYHVGTSDIIGEARELAWDQVW